MSAPVVILARVATVVPLTLLALGLVFVVVVAVIWPTSERQEMVDRLAGAIRDLGAVISGSSSVRPRKPLSLFLFLSWNQEVYCGKPADPFLYLRRSRLAKLYVRQI